MSNYKEFTFLILQRVIKPDFGYQAFLFKTKALQSKDCYIYPDYVEKICKVPKFCLLKCKTSYVLTYVLLLKHSYVILEYHELVLCQYDCC